MNSQNPNHTYSLLELNSMVRGAIDAVLTDEYWVQAELSECYERGGHCYLELIQKSELSNTPVAKARAVIWANVWLVLRRMFEDTTGQKLAKGMKVLIKVIPNFHVAYGFSWQVVDINPTFTMGDLVMRKQDILRKLQDEGILDLNKTLSLPYFCQRIAVVSSPSAAGYGDFCNQIENNSFGFRFHIELFQATMQGENVEKTVIAALDKIFLHHESFDCVVIIRGGGAVSDLTGFDTYNLAVNVANFPLPVITGIGHERDDTILDIVSHTKVKTPTAAAEFLIQHLAALDGFLEQSKTAILRIAKNRSASEKQRLALLSQRLTQSHMLYLERQKHRIEIIQQKLDALNPELLLKRGYSITTLNGQIIKDVGQVKKNMEIETLLRDGKIKSIVI